MTFIFGGTARSDAVQVGAFGDTVTAEVRPLVQIDAVYGLLPREHETFSATGGTVTASASVFSCDCGTSVGGYGVIRSFRVARYHPGQGIRARFTAAFSGGTALYYGGAGLFSATDGVYVGYNGATFGFTRRVAGAIEIRRLTVTNGATGTGDAIVTLNSVATTVAVSSGDSTTVVARKIADEINAAGTWFATQNGATVTFLFAGGVGAKSGTYSVADQGVVGTFSQLQAGADNDNNTGFVAQTSWLDPLDGTGASRFTIDVSKLNVWEIVYPYLGSGTIELRVMEPQTGRFATVHRIAYPNTAVIPSQRNPSFKVGWFSSSLGSTASYTVKGASAMIAAEGPQVITRNPFGASRTATSVSSEVAILSIRNRREFASINNQRIIEPLVLQVGLDGTKAGVIRCYIDATLSAADWSYEDQTDSVAEVEDTNGLTITGGDLIAAAALSGGGQISIDLRALGIRLEPGQSLVVTGEVSGGAGSSMSVALTWRED